MEQRTLLESNLSRAANSLASTPAEPQRKHIGETGRSDAVEPEAPAP